MSLWNWFERPWHIVGIRDGANHGIAAPCQAASWRGDHCGQSAVHLVLGAVSCNRTALCEQHHRMWVEAERPKLTVTESSWAPYHREREKREREARQKEREALEQIAGAEEWCQQCSALVAIADAALPPATPQRRASQQPTDAPTIRAVLVRYTCGCSTLVDADLRRGGPMTIYEDGGPEYGFVLSQQSPCQKGTLQSARFHDKPDADVDIGFPDATGQPIAPADPSRWQTL